MEESVTIQEFLTYYRQCMSLNQWMRILTLHWFWPILEIRCMRLSYGTKVINRGSMQVNKMHKRSAGLVKAGTQAAL